MLQHDNCLTTSAKDEFYTYDGVYQLKTFDRGDLTGSPPTGIGGMPVREEDFTLDPLGNWTDDLQKTCGMTILDQDRTHNKVNEISDITEIAGPTLVRGQSGREIPMGSYHRLARQKCPRALLVCRTRPPGIGKSVVVGGALTSYGLSDYTVLLSVADVSSAVARGYVLRSDRLAPMRCGE